MVTRASILGATSERGLNLYDILEGDTQIHLLKVVGVEFFRIYWSIAGSDLCEAIRFFIILVHVAADLQDIKTSRSEDVGRMCKTKSIYIRHVLGKTFWSTIKLVGDQ